MNRPDPDVIVTEDFRKAGLDADNLSGIAVVALRRRFYLIERGDDETIQRMVRAFFEVPARSDDEGMRFALDAGEFGHVSGTSGDSGEAADA